MPTSTITVTGSVGGITIQGTVSRTAEGQISQEVSLPAADAGMLTARVSDSEGTLTMDDAGHGISTGDIVDVYWEGGVRYGMTVGTVSGTSVPIGGVGGPGAGDPLPAQDTPVTADVQVVVNTDFDGDDLEIIDVMSTRRGHIDFQDSGSASLHATELKANEPWWWISDTGITNPLSGNPVDKAVVSNGDSQNAATLKIGVLYDSVA